MDTKCNPTKPCGPPLIPPKRRKGMKRRKRAAVMTRKSFLLFWIAASLVSVSDGSHVLTRNQCFTCMDIKRCENLIVIYNRENHQLYVRDPNQPFPACSDLSLTAGNKSCAVCKDTSSLIVFCTEDAGHPELEDNNGAQILNVSSHNCSRSLGYRLSVTITPGSGEQQETSGHAHYGLIPAFALIIVLAVLLLFRSLYGQQ